MPNGGVREINEILNSNTDFFLLYIVGYLIFQTKFILILYDDDGKKQD